MNLRRAFTLFTITSALLLAACGNDKNRIKPVEVGKSVVGSIRDRIRPPEREPAEVIIRNQSAEALALAPPGEPLSSIRFDSVGIASVLRRIETNGDHTVWAAWGTSDRKSIITKNGIITSTRGLTRDLMSAESDAVLALVRQREEGTAQYTQRYLDGNFQIVEAKSTCTVSHGYDKSVTIGGREVPVLQMFSSCISANRQFVDLFLVDYTGRILEMRQWVGPVLGFAYMRHLR